MNAPRPSPLTLLGAIDDPATLRALPREALPRVAAEVREHLIAIGAARGGHFAGSLGAVELAVGLHYVFDTPRDRVVWDVGHQAYAHKVLTGRRDALWRVKQDDGPSGFLRRCESPYDAFGAGHAGTSVSAALGMAEAIRRQGTGARVVAVLGDGGATAGMAFEALNHTGEIAAPLRLVFNDNGMSIAPNVGGLHRTGRTADYFRSLGWEYVGPVDGHDFEVLLPALERLREATRPTVLHVKTCKGRGFAPAESDPFQWHATPPFDPRTGKRSGSGSARSWTAAFAEALSLVAERDPRVVAITAAMPDGTGLDRFARRHPGRVYDVGIAEQHAVTFAAGLAAEGLVPVCAIYSTFLQRAFDQIVHDVALQRLPVIFALDRAGLVGPDGPTHHGALDLSYLRAIPGVAVAAPRDEAELLHLLWTGVCSGEPFAIRFPRGGAPGTPLPAAPSVVETGCGELLADGDDVALVGIGRTVDVVRQAGAMLARSGISAAIVDARWVKPLDAELLSAVAGRCGVVVTVEDNALAGGFGSAVLEVLSVRVPQARVVRLGLPDRFIDHGDVERQRREAGIDADTVQRAAMAALGAAGAVKRQALGAAGTSPG